MAERAAEDVSVEPKRRRRKKHARRMSNCSCQRQRPNRFRKLSSLRQNRPDIWKQRRIHPPPQVCSDIRPSGACYKKIVVPKAKTKILMRTSTEKVVTPEITDRILKGLRDERPAASRTRRCPPRFIRKKRPGKPEVVGKNSAKVVNYRDRLLLRRNISRFRLPKVSQ